eukprot:TRINITY_DN17438_c0_g1_i12.p2 TRINITY_DN17438_c0_g1~~TRINITY_DN17438_c0_g1_i12.p2  ORF type:complete len:480 (+),score=37.25 TRINITY_DN17438_c0_g1_i12:107-1441(+)
MCVGVQCKKLRFGSSRGVPYLFNYIEGQGWCNPSFECDMMSYLCWRLGGNDCSLKVFDSLDERITSLENDVVDIVVSRFSVSPDRAERVNFVRPYYYSSGAQLFSLPGDKNLFTSFDNLIAQPVCLDLGYYAASALQDKYGLFIFPSTKDSVLELIKRGYCVATITDSAFVLDGLVQTDVPPVYEQPYAIAISKIPSIENLGIDVQNVLLEMMIRKESGKSMLEQINLKYILSQGIKDNKKLSLLSEAITVNDGNYIGFEAEDDIWNASKITVDKRLLDEFLTIDPKYDYACREALNNILNSYNNGTQISDLPMIFTDAISYTSIVGINDPTDMKFSQVVLQHPFIPTGVTGEQLGEQNPQILTIAQTLQDIYFSDESNQIQGAEFYLIQPLDGTQGIDGDRVRVSLTSPTRVVKTSLMKIIQEKNVDEQLLVAGCGVGEIRNW